MESLKEIKKRINSVKSTRKTTSAMRMVSSAKLRKAEAVITGMRPYSEALDDVMSSLIYGDTPTPLAEARPPRSVAIIAFSSDSSLCGAFNANIIYKLAKTVSAYKKSLQGGNILVYTIGKKAYEAMRKLRIPTAANLEDLAGKADYNRIADLATTLTELFIAKKVDRVEILYHHLRSAGSQILTSEILLPVALPSAGAGKPSAPDEYILEPSAKRLLEVLIPKAIKLKLYTALLDSNASEHAARMIAMQTATDNADDLVDQLTLEYNKSRQQAITNELLDIAGGSRK